MGNRKGRRGTRQRTPGMFTAIPHVVLRHPLFVTCPSRAKALLLDLMEQVKFDGGGGWKNNGDFAITPKVMQGRGWTSRDQLYRARDELMSHRLIVQTRQGGRNHCSLYAITWEPINRCVDKNGHDKLDVNPTYEPVINWHQLEAEPKPVQKARLEVVG